MLSFLEKVWIKLIFLFKQGLSPRDLALSIVVSLLVSALPVLGTDVIVLTCIALPFRLNLPIMIAINYLTTPLKFALLIPFIKFGGHILGTKHTLLSFEAIKSSFDIGFFVTLKSLSYELLCGFVGWTVFAIPLGILSFYILKAILNYFFNTRALTN